MILTITAISITALTNMAAISYGIRNLVRALDRREVAQEIQDQAEQLVEELDNPDDIDPSQIEVVAGNPALTKRYRNRYASKLACMCRASITGCTVRTDRNLATVEGFINTQMKIDNVRIRDRDAVRLAATLFVFTPTAIAVEFRQLEQSIPFIDRVTAGTRNYRSTRTWSDWLTLRFKSRNEPFSRA